MSWWVSRASTWRSELVSINSDIMLVALLLLIAISTYMPRVWSNGPGTRRHDGIIVVGMGMAMVSASRLRRSASNRQMSYPVSRARKIGWALVVAGSVMIAASSLPEGAIPILDGARYREVLREHELRHAQ